MPTSLNATVRVDFTDHDCWEVTHSDNPADSATFSSMTEARSAGHLIAEEVRPSELIVCDAYHDVVETKAFPARARPLGGGHGISTATVDGPGSDH